MWLLFQDIPDMLSIKLKYFLHNQGQLEPQKFARMEKKKPNIQDGQQKAISYRPVFSNFFFSLSPS